MLSDSAVGMIAVAKTGKRINSSLSVAIAIELQRDEDTMALTKKRKEQISNYAHQYSPDIGPEIYDDEKKFAAFNRKFQREIKDFLTTTTDPKELHYFAEQYNWDGGNELLFKLIKNPHCDAGTLLLLYWGGCPEDFYLFNRYANEFNNPYERDCYRLLRQIENKFMKGEYGSASIKFDPTDRISMWDRRDEFMRDIPDVMYQPLKVTRTKKATQKKKATKKKRR